MIDTTFLHQLDKLNLIIRKRITSNYSGSRESTSYGRGIIFKDHKEYVPGDDFRAIDWNVYARTENLFIKRHEEERNVVVHILVDGSASMNFGKDIKKFEYSSMIGLGFAYMALKNNEKFVYSTFSENLLPFKPKKGKKQLVDVVYHLNSLKVTGSSKFSDSLKAYKKMIRSKSLLIVVTDFLFDLEELEKSLPYFRRSDVILVQVLDPIERNMDLSGDLVLHDSESRNVLHTFISRRVKEVYKDRLNEHIMKIQTMCKKLGIEFLSVTTDKPIFDTFYEILS